MLGKAYTTLVQGNQKAIAGFIIAAAGTWLATTGLTLDSTLEEALTALINGGLTAAGVWFKANK